MPKFITIEGIEGVGKTTQMAFIANFLHQHNINVVSTREPGGTPLAEDIRQMLLSPRDEKVAVDTELLLLFASRAQHVAEIIRPAFARKKWVLCDRFLDATFAYQGGGRNVPLARIQQLADWTLDGLTPDLTLLLDAPVDIALQRAADRKQAKDRFEQERAEFFTVVRKGYLARAQAEPNRIKIIDTNKSLPEVQKDIAVILEKLI